MSWLDDKKGLEKIAREIDSSIILVSKDTWFWKALSWLLYIVTFSGLKRSEFLENYSTTLGPVQSYPNNWSADIVERVIIHEGRHTQQARRFGWGVPILGWIRPLAPWVGIPIMGIFYLFLFFPIFLAWFRYRLELDADSYRWKYLLINDMETEGEILHRAEVFAGVVSSGHYFWSIPKKWALWGFNRKAKKVIEQCRR